MTFRKTKAFSEWRSGNSNTVNKAGFRGQFQTLYPGKKVFKGIYFLFSRPHCFVSLVQVWQKFF